MLCYKLDDYENSAKLMGTHIDEAQSTQSVETQIALSGSAAQLYISIDSAHFDQREIVTFYQCHMEQLMSEVSRKTFFFHFIIIA